MDEYRQHILSSLGWTEILFSTIDPFTEDSRLDRVWRFIALIFMENDGELELTQYGNDILVQRTYNETYR
jgi:chromatin segregation and condensation protein Rec8/ScpA/Scc1 (kleisin family)